MRVMIVGGLTGPLGAAAKMVMDTGAKVAQVDSIEQATASLRAGRGADILFVEIEHDIQALIAANESERIVVPVVACGIAADADRAVASIRAGAREFIPLPPDKDLIAAVLHALTRDDREMLARDKAMLAVVKLADQIAPSDASVLITGESGVGKEVMARYLHNHSRRAEKPFISVNCAAIPDNLLESELFGHEKGAFTGALARRIGKFEEADGGTLLLDEISEMDARLQAKLLRALQERIIDRVGGTKPVPVDIRVLATSNRDLATEVKKGTFREDLLYRLNVVNLRIPPLRERREDIIALAESFIAKYSKANGLALRRLSNDARQLVLTASWPGNVRELENAMHRAVLLSGGDIIEPDAIRAPDALAHDVGSAMLHSAFPGGLSRGDEEVLRRAAEVAQAASKAMVGRTVADVEKDLILSTLTHCSGNRTHAANILGISIRTLRNKLKQYIDEGTDVPAPPNGERAA